MEAYRLGQALGLLEGDVRPDFEDGALRAALEGVGGVQVGHDQVHAAQDVEHRGQSLPGLRVADGRLVRLRQLACRAEQGSSSCV